MAEITTIVNKGNLERNFIKKDDLKEKQRYRICRLEQVNTVYGSAIVAQLEIGRIFLPKNYKFNENQCEKYNAEETPKYLHIVKSNNKLILEVTVI